MDVVVPEGVASVAPGDLTSAAVAIDPTRFPPVAGEGAWRSAGYEVAPDRVDIEVEATGSSVRIV